MRRRRRRSGERSSSELRRNARRRRWSRCSTRILRNRNGGITGLKYRHRSHCRLINTGAGKLPARILPLLSIEGALAERHWRAGQQHHRCDNRSQCLVHRITCREKGEANLRWVAMMADFQVASPEDRGLREESIRDLREISGFCGFGRLRQHQLFVSRQFLPIRSPNCIELQ